MSLLIGDEARRLVESFEADQVAPTGRRDEIDLLDREFLIGRRLLPGAAALVVVLLGAFSLTVAAMPDSGLALRSISLVVGTLLVAAGGWLGSRVIGMGRRLLRTYLACAGAGPSASPFTIPARLFSGPGIIRSALAALGFLGAVFGWAFLFLGLAAGDPGGLGDGREAMAVLGAVSGLAFSVTTWALFVGEIRSGLAHSGRVIRSRG